MPAKKTKKSVKVEHPDHRPNLKRLSRIKGQLEGIGRMIEDRRYCPEILTQTRAVAAAIRSLEANMLEKHLGHCVKKAFRSSNAKETATKIEEVIKLFKKL